MPTGGEPPQPHTLWRSQPAVPCTQHRPYTPHIAAKTLNTHTPFSTGSPVVLYIRHALTTIPFEHPRPLWHSQIRQSTAVVRHGVLHSLLHTTPHPAAVLCAWHCPATYFLNKLARAALTTSRHCGEVRCSTTPSTTGTSTSSTQRTTPQRP